MSTNVISFPQRRPQSDPLFDINSIDQTTARAWVEEGIMPLSRYVELFGSLHDEPHQEMEPAVAECVRRMLQSAHESVLQFDAFPVEDPR